MLEAVKVDQQHGQAIVVAAETGHRLLESVDDQRPIGQLCQRVVQRLMRQAGLGQAALHGHGDDP